MMHAAVQHDIPACDAHPGLRPPLWRFIRLHEHITASLHLYGRDALREAANTHPECRRKVPCRFNALDLATGAHKTGSPTAPLAATRTFPNGPLPNNATNFVAIKQLQRPGAAAGGLGP